ncbi:MAG: hypothetical protein AAF471_07230 [Myxococcota bacterium]
MKFYHRLFGRKKPPAPKKRLAVPLLFMHPTTALGVECEDKLFELLDSVILRHIPHHACSTLAEALRWMERCGQPHPFVPLCQRLQPRKRLWPLGSRAPQRDPLEQAMTWLRAWAGNPKRFSVFSVLFTDHALPHLDGVLLCRRAHESVVRMVHGEMRVSLEGDQIERAFYAGLIQFYASAIHGEMEQTVKRKQRDYFDLLCRPLRALLAQRLDEQDSALFEPKFGDVLEEWLEILRPAEFYLWSPEGSVVFVDADGFALALCVRTHAQVQHTLQDPRARQLPESLRRDLRDGVKAICHVTPQGVGLPPDHWEQHVHDAAPVSGRHDFVCCHVPKVNVFGSEYGGIEQFRKLKGTFEMPRDPKFRWIESEDKMTKEAKRNRIDKI